MSNFEAFSEYMAQINDLCCVINLLTWDARTQMPEEGAETRGHQIGTVARIAQERFTSPERWRQVALMNTRFGQLPRHEKLTKFQEGSHWSW